MPSDVFNNEAEQFLLAAILRNPESYFEINTVGLTPQDFANRQHEYIFDAILGAVESKSDPTIPFVIEFLRGDGHSKVVDYVGELSSTPCSVSQAVEYAKVIKGLAVSRNLGKAGARIIDIASEKRSDFNSAIVEAENVIRAISEDLPKQERSPVVSEILSRMSIAPSEDRIPLSFSRTLQSMTGGLSRGHFWVVGGFSSTGKSAFATNLALDIMRVKGKKVAIISAEMTQEQYIIRMLSVLSGVSQRDIASRFTVGFGKQERVEEAKRFLSNSSLFVYDNLYRLPQIRTELQRLKNLHGLDVIILDYIQNVSVTGDEVSDAREVALECQRMAKDFQCTVIGFSQLSNAQAKYEMEGGDENYYSLKGHGSIRDAADVVLTLHRDRVANSSALKVKFRKNRHGPMSDFTCEFNLETGQIKEREWSEEDYE